MDAGLMRSRRAVLEAGRPLELDWLAGKVVALGRKYGVPTPAQEAVYAILKPYRTGLIR
jgi:2-dehydropantoate 2-reductase